MATKSRLVKFAEWLAAVAMAGSLVGCATAGASSSATAASVADALQGVQLDVLGGGAPAPGGTTTVFVQQGDRATELYWKTDGWCVSREYSWSVTDVADAYHFSVDYHVVREHTDCVQHWGSDMRLMVSGARVVDGHTVYEGTYGDPLAAATTRTVCTTEPVTLTPSNFGAATGWCTV